VRSRNGGIFLDLPQPNGSVKDFKIEFSSRSSKRLNKRSWHFDRLTKHEQKTVLRRLDQLEAERVKFPEEAQLEKEAGYKMGYYPEVWDKSYGWRDHLNIEYFRRAMDQKVARFLFRPLAEQEALATPISSLSPVFLD